MTNKTVAQKLNTKKTRINFLSRIKCATGLFYTEEHLINEEIADSLFYFAVSAYQDETSILEHYKAPRGEVPIANHVSECGFATPDGSVILLDRIGCVSVGLKLDGRGLGLLIEGFDAYQHDIWFVTAEHEWGMCIELDMYDLNDEPANNPHVEISRFKLNQLSSSRMEEYETRGGGEEKG